MRVITWNLHGASNNSPVWQIILDLKPDIALLQEVGNMPESIEREFECLSRKAIYKTGRPQRFSTAILVRGKIINVINLTSEYQWVNNELDYFRGNLVSCVVQPINQKPINVVSVYSPPWPVDEARLEGIDVSHVKLKLNPKIWVSEIIWSALKNTVLENETWIVGGDYNSSETFDKEWQLQTGVKTGLISNGNKEIRERMYALKFKECLREYNGKLTPTYRHTNKKLIHQLDHLYVSNNLYLEIIKCTVGDETTILEGALSDHLPIIADFR